MYQDRDDLELISCIYDDQHRYIYINDISDEQDLSFEYLAKEFGKQGMELTDRNMVSLGLVRSDGKYTNLAFMLSDQSDVTVKIAEYDKHYNFRLKKQFTGPLVELFHETKEQADRLNDVSATIDVRTFRRNEIESYPGASLREMILNAFVHADYFIRSNIKVEFFGDRCRITSPGGIFNASMEEIMNGTQTYRNHNLVNVFYKLGLIENFGTGIPRTMEAYDGQERQPVFKATENFFYVTLPNLNWSADDQINDQTNDHINTNMNEVDLKILKEIYDHPGINACVW
ncbi:MAG: hypothetical protein HUJ57_00575 [Erysipelotrichaceae bacterium]|nr:hypothetical protein [Erysipelotrichaceae bacterium]